MKLLFDQNLSHRLTRSLGDLFPGSQHVRAVGLQSASDEEVWIYAAQNGFVIASLDSDFRQRSFLRGHPPKVVWIRRGNSSTSEIEALLRQRAPEIEGFERDRESSLLIVE